ARAAGLRRDRRRGSGGSCSGAGCRWICVVLVLVGPVQLDLLAVVGDGVGAVAVAALGGEVAVVVVAAEEGDQRVIDFAFLAGDVKAECVLFLKLPYLGRFIGIEAGIAGSLTSLGDFAFQLHLVAAGEVLEGILDDLRQVV